MSSDNKPTIIERRLELRGKREKKIAELIAPYDRDVFNPAMVRLREECAGKGHDPISGKAGIWQICGNCGDSFLGKIKK